MYCSRGERPLAPLGKAQDLVALELGEAVDDGLCQALHGCSLSKQLVIDLLQGINLALEISIDARLSFFKSEHRCTFLLKFHISTCIRLDDAMEL